MSATDFATIRALVARGREAWNDLNEAIDAHVGEWNDYGLEECRRPLNQLLGLLKDIEEAAAFEAPKNWSGDARNDYDDNADADDLADYVYEGGDPHAIS